MTIRSHAVDEAQYLGNKAHPAGIYGAPTSGSFYSPFDGSFDPMDRLLLVDFDDDPDYLCVELQIIDDPRRGTGAVVLLYRTDGGVDVYHTPGLRLDASIYELVSPGGRMTSTIIRYGLEITPAGTIGRVELRDRTGRLIEVFMQTPKTDRPTLSMLAPIGDIVKAPQMFPFFYIQAFDFAPRSESKVRIRIDGKSRAAARIPILVNGARVYKTRYSFSPAIGIWNRTADRELSPVRGDHAAPAADGAHYQLSWVEGHPEIARVTWADAGHVMSFAFSPPIPDLVALRTSVVLEGKFSAGMDASAGVFAGEYRVRKAGEETTIEIHPLEGWQPQPGKLWLKTYHWKAAVSVRDGRVYLQSKWSRK